jgi:hypothetical protein
MEGPILNLETKQAGLAKMSRRHVRIVNILQGRLIRLIKKYGREFLQRRNPVCPAPIKTYWLQLTMPYAAYGLAHTL